MAAILKRYNIFNFFCRIVIFYSPYIYGANFIAKFRWEGGFLKGGSMEPPWAPTGVKVQRFSRAGPRGRGREWATLGVHPLSWLLSNNRLEKVPVVSVPHTSSNRLLLSNQDKGCTPIVAHSLPLPLGPALLNLSSTLVT